MKRFLVVAIAVVAVVVFAHLVPHALAAEAQDLNVPLSLPTQALGPNDVKVGNIPQFIITLLFVVAILIAIVFLIYGGIKWILSGGDTKQVEGARNHIVAAIVGLIIVVGAFVILNIVFTILTGKGFDPRTGICIPSLTNPDCTNNAVSEDTRGQ